MNTLDKPAIRTTPVELLGHENVNFEFGEIGYYDCPLEITSQQEGSQIHYQVDIKSPPLQNHAFLRFLNIVAPSEGQQFNFGISEDWKIAKDPDDYLFQKHARLGRPWNELVSRIDPLLDVIDCHAEEWSWKPHVDNIDRHQKWLESLPETVFLDKDWCRRAVSFGTGSLLHGLRDAGIDSPEDILLGIISHMASLSDVSYYRREPELSRIMGKMLSVDSKLENHQKITAFTKLPLRYRILAQGNVLYFITHDDSVVPLHADSFSSYRTRYIFSPQADKIKQMYWEVVDRDGKQSFANVRHSWYGDIPKDYRALDEDTIETVRHPNGMFEADALVVNLGKVYANRDPQRKVFMDPRSLRQLRGFALHPKIAWTDDYRSDGTFRTDWDLSTVREEQDVDGIPHTVYGDGLLGLMAVAGFSPDLKSAGDVWKTERELPKNDRERKQVMGAAQLPLLSLMFKRDIARAGFANSVRGLVAAQ